MQDLPLLNEAAIRLQPLMIPFLLHKSKSIKEYILSLGLCYYYPSTSISDSVVKSMTSSGVRSIMSGQLCLKNACFVIMRRQPPHWQNKFLNSRGLSPGCSREFSLLNWPSAWPKFERQKLPVAEDWQWLYSANPSERSAFLNIVSLSCQTNRTG